jgi:sugar/nucleoside kinase (ribokinase family)
VNGRINIVVMIYSVGHIAYDFLMDIKEFPEKSSSVPITGYTELHGGAAANFALVCGALGEKTSLVSVVGEDFRNSDYQKYLKKKGIGLDCVRVVKGKRTPRAFMFNDSHGDQRTFFLWGAGKEFERIEVPQLKLPAKSDLIHIATGDPEFNIRFSKKYKGKISFDPGQDIVLYDGKSLERIIGNCKFLFCNENEFARIREKTYQEDLFELGRLLKYVVVTKGPKGSTIFTPHEYIDIRAVKAKAIDPTGAGDAYRAGFLVSFLKGLKPKECGDMASAVASIVVESVGAQTRLPSWSEAEKRLK